jgi:hypothetical protein
MFAIVRLFDARTVGGIHGAVRPVETRRRVLVPAAPAENVTDATTPVMQMMVRTSGAIACMDDWAKDGLLTDSFRVSARVEQLLKGRRLNLGAKSVQVRSAIADRLRPLAKRIHSAQGGRDSSKHRRLL